MADIAEPLGITTLHDHIIVGRAGHASLMGPGPIRAGAVSARARWCPALRPRPRSDSSVAGGGLTARLSARIPACPIQAPGSPESGSPVFGRNRQPQTVDRLQFWQMILMAPIAARFCFRCNHTLQTPKDKTSGRERK